MRALAGGVALSLALGAAPGAAQERVTLFVTSRKTDTVQVLRVGRYPFHAPKRGRDGNDVPPTATEMWFSDQGLTALVSVSLADRRVLGSVVVGTEPFHLTAIASGTLFVANHASGTVTIVDASRRAVLGTLQVAPRPHGLAVLAR